MEFCLCLLKDKMSNELDDKVNLFLFKSKFMSYLVM